MATHRSWVALVSLATLALLSGNARAQETPEASAASEPKEAAPDDGDEILDNGKTRRETVAMYSYCESDNCYEKLGVKPTSGQIAIKRAYRRFASEWHPDKNPHPDAKAIFQKYANAYEVLSNTEMRKNYDYLLAHPYEFPMHFLRFSSVSYAPKSDVRFVLFVIVAGISIAQYFFLKQRRTNVIDAVKGQRHYQERLKIIATEIAAATSKASKPVSGSGKSATSSKNKVVTKSKSSSNEEAAKLAEAQLLAELADELPPEPAVQDTLAYVIFTLPLTFSYWVHSTSNWVLKFHILGQAYGPTERALLTRSAIGFTPSEWAALTEEEREELAGRELWISENKAAYDEEVAAEEARPVARTNKEKRNLRLKKKNIDAAPMMD